MKANRTLRGFVFGLATAGLVLSSTPGVGAAPVEKVAPAVKIIDVSLAGGNTLRGQIMNAEGHVLANAPVVLHQGKEQVAKTVTDRNGEFQLTGVKGGVYVVSTDGAAGVVRAWTDRTAPPAAVKGVLLVPQNGTTRGQLLGGGPLISNWGLGALIIGGVAATVIAVSIDHNSAS